MNVQINNFFLNFVLLDKKYVSDKRIKYCEEQQKNCKETVTFTF